MVELFKFIFQDWIHFLGTLVILNILSTFKFITINNHYDVNGTKTTENIWTKILKAVKKSD